MGKLYHGALGRVKGSVGNTTYRRIYGEANASAVYDKVLEVANPKTGNQILQRAKMPPAQKFYEHFKSVLDHSRQGLQAGEITRRAFMSDCMKKNFRGWAYVQKGFEGLIPSRYPISKGVLAPIGMIDFNGIDGDKYQNHESVHVQSLSFESEQWTRDASVVSQGLLVSNPERFQAGDELTFMFVVSPADIDSKENMAMVCSLVLDETNSYDLKFAVMGHNGTDLYVAPLSAYGEDQYIVAAACIHSRKVGTSWQYSTETMSVEPDYYTYWGNVRHFNLMMQSYGAAGYNDANSRRQLEQATNQPYNGNISTGKWYAKTDGEPIYYLLSMTQSVTGGKQANVNVGVFVKDDALVSPTGEVVTQKKGEVDAPVKPSDIGWAGPVVQWQDAYLEQVPSGSK